jgi:hypothetical protein
MAGRAAPHRSSDAHAGIRRRQRNQRCTVHADLVPARSAWDWRLDRARCSHYVHGSIDYLAWTGLSRLRR